MTADGTLEHLDRDRLAAVRTLADFEVLSRQFLSHSAYEYLEGGAGSGLTAMRNRASFDQISLMPRFLVDVTELDTSMTLLGRRHDFPVLLAPTGYHKLMHPEGELATVCGAQLSGATLVAACFSTVAYEDMRAASTQPLWFQLYFQEDREFTKDLVDRVVEAGVEAICVSVDVPVNGPRDRELRAGFRLPEGVFRSNLIGLGEDLAGGAHRPSGRNIYSATHAADVTWKDIEWLRALTPKPLLLKGILHPHDAALAVAVGCDGVIVSNHGGRSLDTVVPTMRALPGVLDRIGGRVPVLLDGGVRRGVDIFKALARGASAVLVGRPYLHGLAVGGGPGVARVVEILRTELEMTMGLIGCRSVAEISRRFLVQ